MISDIESHLKTPVSIFENDADVREMPFMWQFPKNCCERIAALLCETLKRKYPDAQVVYVTGENPKTGEMHFWVEINDIVVDATAHQFNEIENPLVCYKPSPLEGPYCPISRTEDPTAGTDLTTNSNGKWHSSLATLCRAFGV